MEEKLKSVSNMSELEAVSPPEGQTSFSGIPEAQFVEDVEGFMTGEDNAEDKLKVRCC